MLLQNPNILVNACSPGFILTDMTAKYADAGSFPPPTPKIIFVVTVVTSHLPFVSGKLKTADEGSCANTPIWLALSDIHGSCPVDVPSR
jgi:NAD(P)-dependent dehydrogenase (short-subunit alcohol dehydrogenase family)